MVELKEKDFKYIFGPVRSRRLGISLGVDLMPYKTCTMDCVYCESGKTTCLTNERKEYVPTAEVLAELDDFLSDSPKLDYITFSGSGEPTLHLHIGRVIDHLKDNYPYYKIAVLTNSSLFPRPELRKELLRADLIVASQDAVSGKPYEHINRPHESINSSDVLAGLYDMRREYDGQLWLEIFVIPGVNDDPVELGKIRDAFDLGGFDRIQINTLDRPGTEEWVTAPDASRLEEVRSFFGDRVELIPDAVAAVLSSGCEKSSEDRILSTLIRRPLTLEDIIKTLGLEKESVSLLLKEMLGEGKIVEKEMARGIFYLLP